MISKIVVYGVKGCVRCTKVLKFLDEHDLSYVFKNLSKEHFTVQEISDILWLTDNGFEDLVTNKSAAYAQMPVPFEDMAYKDAIAFVIEHQQITHRPIIIQYFNNKPLRLLIGYNANDIKVLLRNDDEKYFGHSPCSFHTDHCHVEIPTVVSEKCGHDKE